MDPKVIAFIVVVAALAFIFFILRNRKGGVDQTEESCGRIACEPIVPVEERNEEGVGPDERKIDGDITVHQLKTDKDKEACEPKD